MQEEGLLHLSFRPPPFSFILPSFSPRFSLYCIQIYKSTERGTIQQHTIRAVSWLRSLVAGLSSRSPGFALGSILVGFVVDKVTLGQVFLRVFRFSAVSILFHRRLKPYLFYVTSSCRLKPDAKQLSNCSPAPGKARYRNGLLRIKINFGKVMKVNVTERRGYAYVFAKYVPTFWTLLWFQETEMSRCYSSTGLVRSHCCWWQFPTGLLFSFYAADRLQIHPTQFIDLCDSIRKQSPRCHLLLLFPGYN
jgi:hypothetical protein